MNSKKSSTYSLEERFEAKINLLRKQCQQQGFKFFVHTVFAQSFPEFIRGQYIDDVIDHIDENPFTMDVTGRDHFKSTRLYARIMYRIFTQEVAWEGHYFSFSRDMAEYHLMKINALIESNPIFSLMKNHKPTSDYMLIYSWGMKGAKIMIKPKGLFEFKRGIHSEGIFVDDALKDVDAGKELDPTIIYKVNEVIKSEILPMVKRGGECRIVGTPQTDEDFFFDKSLRTKFKVWITPAIVDRAKQIALWPEWMSFKELLAKEVQLGARRFSREYMARPVRSQNSYIPQAEYEAVEKLNSWKFKDWREELADKIVVGGFDIGKKRHPSHCALFIKTYEDVAGERMPRYQQIYSEWFDHIDYFKQIERLNDICEMFNVSKMNYDNTRAEFEAFAEEDKLHWSCEPVVFTTKNRNSMAAI